jgi:sialic acid synthase SpsE
LPIIMSTGMASLGEVEAALGVLAFGYLDYRERPSLAEFYRAWREDQGRLQEKVTLLHCTTEYPAPFGEVNLRAMETLATAFGLPVGYSDHTLGITVAVAAAALGARVIEKHFTLDKTLPGPDHKASLDPDELRDLVQSIRQVEAALGSRSKISSPSELKNRDIVRRSLVAARSIRKGEFFSKDNLTSKRPGTGISPFHYWELLGRLAYKDFQADEVISLKDF